LQLILNSYIISPMPKTKEIKVLYTIKPRKEWIEDILAKLDLRAVPFDDLAKEFGFEKPYSPEYNDLMCLVSDLMVDKKTRVNTIPAQIKSAHLEGTNIYPLYLTNQEKELIENGTLPRENEFINLRLLAREEEMKRTIISHFLHRKER